MTTVATRLQKLTQELSPLQRAVLVLKEMREERDVDPVLLRIDDEPQRRAFNRYMMLLYVLNRELASVCRVVEDRTEQLETTLGYSETFNEAAQLIEVSEGWAPAKATRAWRTKPKVTVPEFLRGLALELKDEAIEGVVFRWQELQALETVWAELSQDFQGEDAVLPQLRAQAADTAARLRTVAKHLGVTRRLVDGDDALLDQYRAYVNEGFQQLGLAEPYR